MHIIAAKAVALGEALKPEFKAYQEQILKNAQVLAESLKEAGFELVSGGTDNHLMLVDLRPANITGKEMEKRLDQVNITVNKNTIPDDPQSPFVTSGIRVGVPAATSRGLKEEDMKILGKLMWMAATDFDNKKDEIIAEVAKITAKYPMYE
jgi:glycine hydroxymethyltransferase